MKYKGIVFDLDGTIIDSETGIAKGFQKALASKGVAEEISAIKELIGPPLSRTIITKYGFDEKDAAEAMAIHREYYSTIGVYESDVYAGIVPMLEELKKRGLRLMIATNKAEEYAVKQLEHHGLLKYFDSVSGNDLLQKKGLKRDFIEEALEKSGMDKNDVVMVGDRFNDIDAAKEMEMDTIGVLYGYGSVEEIEGTKPTYIIKTPLELLEII
ncbi:MAG: HAD-IA family hydrolase [Eubacteriaceae bacterium]|nr:HAD-IA family hydrolase [Eubacteriaceae bacterium]